MLANYYVMFPFVWSVNVSHRWRTQIMLPAVCCSVEGNIEATEIINVVQQKSASSWANYSERKRFIVFFLWVSCCHLYTEVCLDVQSEPGVVGWWCNWYYRHIFHMSLMDGWTSGSLLFLHLFFIDRLLCYNGLLLKTNCMCVLLAQGYLGPAGAPYLPPGIPPSQPYTLPSDPPASLHSLPPNVSVPPNNHSTQPPYMR